MMQDYKPYFILFQNCIPVSGASRSTICDLQYNRYRFIPNLLYEILTKHKRKKITQIKRLYKNKYDNGIDQFFNLLKEEGFGFYTDQPNSFSDMDLYWDFPGLISNAIIDINENEHDIKPILNQLEELGCEALQIRCFSDTSLLSITKIMGLLEKSSILYVELLFPFNERVQQESLKELFDNHLRLKSIVVHDSGLDELITLPDGKGILYTSEQIKDASHCGFVYKEQFSANIKLYTENQKFNSCLNRKVSIDIHGNIKNCPASKEIYGHISNDSILNAISNEKFKKYWILNKDQIEVCKDCEFRYMCTDCRTFIKDPENIFSKPLKCNYNPYTETWEN